MVFREGVLTMRIRSLVMAVWMIALAVVVGLSPARADVGTLVLGSNYSTITDAGSYDPSSWNATPLQFLYCIDIYDYISPPATYGLTVATNNGTVTMTRNSTNGVKTGYVDYSWPADTTKAGHIAWLLDNYGIGGQNTTQVVDLQEAIWLVIYGYGYKVAPSATAQGWAAASLTQSGNVGGYLWFSPHDSAGAGDVHQALVGKLYSVPEPTSVVVLGVFLLAVVLGLGAKRRLA
jgi:hypothetical protein